LQNLDKKLKINNRSYRLVETYEERLARLEANYIKYKLLEVEEGD